MFCAFQPKREIVPFGEYVPRWIPLQLTPPVLQGGFTAGPGPETITVPGLPPDLTRPPTGCRFAARCPRASAQCIDEEPPLSGEDPAHLFACWHPVDGPVLRLPDIYVGDAPRRERTATHLLEIKNAVREFPVTAGVVLQRKVNSVKAVSDVTLHVDAGETLGLVGESGCGKTTLGKLIVGAEKPDSGTIELDGKEVFGTHGRALRRARRDLQMMFQDPYASLDPRMRVHAILREPLQIQGIGTRKERDERINRLLGEVGLPLNALERYPHEFSGGQRQRIGLARALMLEPKVVVVDEPVSALDVSIRSQVLNLMKRLQAEHNMTSIVISHDLAVVKYLADRIGVMYLGKLVELGTGDDIYRRPLHPYTDALIKTIPLPDPAAEKAKEQRREIAQLKARQAKERKDYLALIEQTKQLEIENLQERHALQRSQREHKNEEDQERFIEEHHKAKRILEEQRIKEELKHNDSLRDGPPPPKMGK